MPDKALTLRLDKSIHERLRKEAYEQDVSISQLIRWAIADKIRDWDRDDSGPWPVPREDTRRAEHETGSTR